MQAYRFDRTEKNHAAGALSVSPAVVSAFAWFRTDTPDAEQCFMCLGGAREGIRAVGLREGRPVAATGVHGDLRWVTDIPSVAKDQWVHICAVWTERQVQLYVGGKPKGAASVPFLPSAVYHVGCMGGFTGALYFSGELARWGWVPWGLSQQEVKELSDGGEWPLDAEPRELELVAGGPEPIEDEAPVTLPAEPARPVTASQRQPRRMG